MSTSESVYNEYKYIEGKAGTSLENVMSLSPLSKDWKEVFARSFSYFSKLWKIQGQHRNELKKHGFTRKDVGLIAIRIAQLFTQYYLFTGDVNTLKESEMFCTAVKKRKYFGKIEDQPSFVVQQYLRYHARYLVTLVLLGDGERAAVLADELDALKELLIKKGGSETEVKRWNTLCDEIKTFLQGYNSVKIIGDLPAELKDRRFKHVEVTTEYKNTHTHTLEWCVSASAKSRREVSGMGIEGLLMRHTMEFTDCIRRPPLRHCVVRGDAACVLCAVSAQRGSGMVYVMNAPDDEKQMEVLEAVEAVIEGRKDVLVIVDGDSAIDWEKLHPMSSVVISSSLPLAPGLSSPFRAIASEIGVGEIIAESWIAADKLLVKFYEKAAAVLEKIERVSPFLGDERGGVVLFRAMFIVAMRDALGKELPRLRIEGKEYPLINDELRAYFMQIVKALGFEEKFNSKL